MKKGLVKINGKFYEVVKNKDKRIFDCVLCDFYETCTDKIKEICKWNCCIWHYFKEVEQ